MLTAILQSVILGWVWRRFQELVGAAAWTIPIFLMLPEEHRDLVFGVLRGEGGGYSISAYAGFGLYLWTQFQSYRATVRPQVVTSDKRKIELQPGTVAQQSIERQASAAPKRRTLWDMITNN